MSQQAQLFRLKRTGREGEPLWAYRYRMGGRASKRVQRGGFACERDAAAFWGCVLSLMGFIGYGAMAGMDFMTYVAGKPGTGLDPTTMQNYIDTAIDTTAIIAPVMAVFFLLVAGLIVFAVGAVPAGVLHPLQAAFMPIGITSVAAFLDDERRLPERATGSLPLPLRPPRSR